jgi:hypothetical protein
MIPLQQPSIADIEEGRLVRLLRNNQIMWDSITNIAGLPEDPIVHLELPLDGAPGSAKGDIDILLYPRYWPSSAAAIQAKRIKVKGDAFRPGGSPNGLQGYRQGARQANILAEMGFSLVYLYLFVLVDSREHNEGRITFAGLTSELDAIIANAMSLNHLDQRVGLVVHEFTQPMDFTPLTEGAGGTRLIRLARPTSQPPALTAWLATLG